MDRFASAASVQNHPHTGAALPYWGLWADARACGVDALTADWRGMSNYAFPPVALVGHVLQLVREQGVKAVVVVPQWESQWWWPLACELADVVVDLASIARGPVLVAAREGGPDHPFGAHFPNPYGVQWVALIIRGR